MRPVAALRFSIVAYFKSASVAVSFVVSSVPIFAFAAVSISDTFRIFAFTSVNFALLAMTTSSRCTFAASMLSIASPSTVPLSVVMLTTVSLVSSYFCAYSSKLNFTLDISQVFLSGLSGYSVILTILCCTRILVYLSIISTVSPREYCKMLYFRLTFARSSTSQVFATTGCARSYSFSLASSIRLSGTV